MVFKIKKTSQRSLARTGVLNTAHGRILTPCFMPIATRGAVKSLLADDLKGLGAQIILSNTYHLWQRPGLSVLKKAGGLHEFMNWSGPILTDSGGYQVFSLARRRKILNRGVEFISEIDGKKYLLTPQKAIEIQRILGSDIMMSLDECTPYPATRQYALKSLELTTRWAKQGLLYFKKKRIKKQLLFGIVQGSVWQDLRQQSANELVNLDFDGYAIGGLAVGEPIKLMHKVLDYTVPVLPKNKPRYLMGVGKPEQIVSAVKKGIDMFDCVIPTRNARHGMLYIYKNDPQALIRGALKQGLQATHLKRKFYQEIRIKQSKYAADLKPVDPLCDCCTCQRFSRAYLRHLFMCQDPLASRLATIHNLHFYMRLMKMIRARITKGIA